MSRARPPGAKRETEATHPSKVPSTRCGWQRGRAGRLSTECALTGDVRGKLLGPCAPLGRSPMPE
eukprot:5870843-Pyramimonas_sp.AAC.1